MNEQQEERYGTADFAAGRTRDDRAERSGDSREQHDGQSTSQEPTRTPLFPTDEAESFKGRWTTIQSGFVDEPRKAVEQADQLIAEVMKALAGSFADERRNLEQQWDRGGNVSTEDLRLGLRRYRSFFDRLLSI
jgi:hypothetical protein